MLTIDRKSHFVVAKMVKGRDKLTIVSGPGDIQLMSAEDASNLAREIHDELNMETFVCQLYQPVEKA